MTNTFDKPSSRPKKVRLKTARGRTQSSQRWLSRQLNDPYVTQAKRDGYRSRAAFKLKELNEKVPFLKPGQHVIDLGAAPGGWTQMVLEIVKPSTKNGRVVGIDLLPMDPLADAHLMQGDFLDPSVRAQLLSYLDGPVHVVLSDMAASTTGNATTDHLRTLALADMAWQFAKGILAEEGTFVTKVFQGGADKDLLTDLKRHFKVIKHIKPPASRKESPEMYVVAVGFRP